MMQTPNIEKASKLIMYNYDHIKDIKEAANRSEQFIVDIFYAGFINWQEEIELKNFNEFTKRQLMKSKGVSI